MSLGNQEAPRTILASGTSFREDLVMKLFLRHSSCSADFMKSSCQLMSKGCVLNTGYLPRGDLPRNSVDRITDRPDMTSTVDRGRKGPKEDWFSQLGHPHKIKNFTYLLTHPPPKKKKKHTQKNN